MDSMKASTLRFKAASKMIGGRRKMMKNWIQQGAE
jgi:hypothetical protein